MLGGWTQDFRYAVRQLGKHRGFTAVALISLAFGIGANTAIFSLVNAVLLRSLPLPNPHELRILKWSGADVKIEWFSGRMNSAAQDRVTVADAFSYPVFTSLRADCHDLAQVFGYKPLYGATLRARRAAFVAEGVMVSDNFFAALGVRPRLGRLLTAADDQGDAAAPAVISYAVWEQQFDLDPGVLGEAVTVNGRSFAVVGVLPRGFAGLRPDAPTALYVPMSAQPALEPGWSRTADNLWWVQVMARLAPRTTDERFRAAAAVSFARNAGSIMRDPTILVRDGRAGPSAARNGYREPLLVLLGVVGIVILVACANIAGLSLARGAAREHEYAIRGAIGAGRWRLARQSLIESLTLALLGAGCGVVLAVWGKTAIARLLAGSPDGLRFDTALDTTVLGFTFLTALITALLAGSLPALRAGRVDPTRGLQSRGTRGAPRLRMGRSLVVVQVALSLLLLSVAGLYGRSLFNLLRIDPGFETDHLLVFQLDAAKAGYGGDRTSAFDEQVRSAVAALPGVRAAALSQWAMLSGTMSGGGFFTLPGHAYPTSGPAKPQAHRLTVSEDFFATMGVPMLRGRAFRTSDDASGPKVVVVNRAFADRYLAGEDPIGQVVRTGDASDRTDWQIVGVSGDVRYTGLRADLPPTVYFSFRQDPVPSTYFVVRTAAAPLALVPAVRNAVAAVDPNVPIAHVSTQRQLRDADITQDRLFAVLCGALAGLALFLSCVGLYGLMAFNVARRTGEIGIRMAIGALPRDIARPILHEALVLGGVGVVIGVPAALVLSRVIRAQLYGVRPTDPIAYAAGVLLLVGVAAGAAWIPARRAASVDPMEALRRE
jgi:predicted permease